MNGDIIVSFIEIYKKRGEEMKSLKDKTIVITGASRGVGREIALRAAKDGANVVILAKTAEPHSKLSGTIYTVAEEVDNLGGRALPLAVDVRSEDNVRLAVDITAETFGGIDILVNNASAVILNPTEKQILLMNQVIVDGTRFCTEACLPYLQKSENAHVINIAPPLPMAEHWIKKYGEYAVVKRTVSEYMAMMAGKYPSIIFNTLWPQKMLYTAATISLFGEEKARKYTRSAEIMADVVALILESRQSGRFFTDEQALEELGGITDFSRYLLQGSKVEDLYPDVFI